MQNHKILCSSQISEVSHSCHSFHSFCYTGVAAGSRIHLRGAEFTLRNPAPLAARVLGGHEVRMGFGWRLYYFLIDISKTHHKFTKYVPTCCIHPASRGVAARGKNRSKTSCSTMLPIGASQAKQFSLFPPVEASQARIFTFPPRGGFPS